MIVSSPSQISLYQEATRISTQILEQLKAEIKEGIYPIEIENKAQKLCQKFDVEPSFAPVDNGMGAYGYALCISINDTVLHGIPSKEIPFKTGDIVKLDFGIIYKGLHTDQCITIGVHSLSKKNKRLVATAKKAVESAIPLAIVGNTTGDLGASMSYQSRIKGYQVLSQYIGHGIGLSLHDNPPIPAYGKPNSGHPLVQGMVLCLEAQLVAGNNQVYVTDDGWSVKTKDGKNSAMFEYMVIVGKTKPTLLTPTTNWPLIVN